MATYFLHTLVDISENGNLNKVFPFTTSSGQLIHDKDSLQIAKNQQHNFNTLIQTLQLRANVTWEQSPICTDIITANTQFGSAYEGKHKSWVFIFHTELSSVYESNGHAVGSLTSDLDYVPILNFCKETATFPHNVFITNDPKYTNIFALEVTEQTPEEIIQSYTSQE